MKVFKTIPLLAPMLLLAGCATSPTDGQVDANTAIGTASNVGMAVFKTAVDQRCRSELTQNQYWKIASVAMTKQKQAEVQDNVCGCVSEKSAQSVTLVDLTTIAIDSSARSQVVGKAVANTLQSCYSEIVK